MLSSSPLSLDMAKVDPYSCWDGVANVGDEEFENILSILDFPMESVEEDGFTWDNNNSFHLGPIPSDMLGVPTFTQTKTEMGPPVPLRRQFALVDPKPEQEPLPYQFVEAPTSCVLGQNKSTEVHEQGVFQSQSPVSVLENNGSASAGKSSLINSRISKRTRSKRARPSGSNPWLLIPPLFSNTHNAKKIREGIKKMSRIERAKKTIRNSSDRAHPVYAEPQIAQRQAVAKKCTHCEVTKTPQWREGPLGPKTLCNACGVRYRSGRLYPEYRPAASPTFVPSIHSNSHRKVIEMRSKGKREMEQALVSPELEFIPVSGYFFDPIR